MKTLHNRISHKEMKERLLRETDPRVTISFYQYHPIEDPASFRDYLYRNLEIMRVFGRIYVAKEGINAQISVPAPLFEDLKKFLYSIPFLSGIRLNLAVKDDGKSFWVLKIKVRNKVVADGIEDLAFDMSRKGKYVDAVSFNEMTSDPNTLVVDMRNHYEYEVGHFENAIEIPSDTFREQLPMAVKMLEHNKERNIIMYCTGGIRCEKASAWMMHNGFKNVFHLEGGIIHYAHKVNELNLPNKFKGKNFVFDGRLGEAVGEEVISVCHQCGKPCDTHTNCANEGCHLLFIQCRECAEKMLGCCSEGCRSIIQLPEPQKRQLRKGKKNGLMVFNKSRSRMSELINRPIQGPIKSLDFGLDINS